MLSTLLVALVTATVGQPQNNRPIVAILALPNEYKSVLPQYSWYIPASYVKWLESAGARVGYILPEWDDEHIVNLVSKFNGVLFTGGASPIDTGRFAQVQRVIANTSLSLNANTPYSSAMWATCLGFEAMMSHTASARGAVVTHVVGAEDVALPMQLSPECTASTNPPCYLLSSATPPDALNPLLGCGTAPVAYHHHAYGVLNSTFYGDAGLRSTWRVISTSAVMGGEPFVTAVESLSVLRGVPWFATQFHPEKPQFEWKPTTKIPHSAEAIHANQYLSERFMSMVRRSTQQFVAEEAWPSFVNQTPHDSANYSSFDQLYYW